MQAEWVNEEADPLFLNKAWISNMETEDVDILAHREFPWVTEGWNEAVRFHQAPCHPRSGWNEALGRAQVALLRKWSTSLSTRGERVQKPGYQLIPLPPRGQTGAGAHAWQHIHRETLAQHFAVQSKSLAVHSRIHSSCGDRLLSAGAVFGAG